MPKSLLRKTILACRMALSEADQEAFGNIIQEAFLEMPEYLAAGSVALYCPVHCEAPTGKALDQALLAGKSLFLPAVEGDRMLFRRIRGLHDLVPGRFGIMQPAPECASADPEEIDLIVVPGVGFDFSGRRIGYGKGFYDRALHKLESSGKLVAFCYELQLVDSLAAEKHDVNMDRIITERRIITPALLK